MVLTEQQKNYLTQTYYDISKKGALRGPTTLYKQAQLDGWQDISLNKIKFWLRSQPTYTRWKPARKTYGRNRIEAHFVGDLMQFDLADFHNEKETDPVTGDVKKYLLVCVDSFSRYVFCVALNDRTSTAVISGLHSVFNTGYIPENALCDPAGEHVSTQMKKFFKKMGVHLYFTTSKIHAPQAERFVRTLRTALRRYRAANNTNRWLYATQQIVNNYNRTITRVHAQKPIDVFQKPEIAWKAYEKLYFSTDRKSKPKQEQMKKPRKKLPSVGQYVRLSRLKHPFEKESGETGNFTREVFKVVGIDSTKKFPMFKLEDTGGKILKGKAYLEEIQPIEYNPEQYFEVEKVLRKQKYRGVKRVLVKWKGYSNKFNSWIPESGVKNVFVDTMLSDVH